MGETTRAVVARGYGGPEVLAVVDAPMPPVGPGQVRVRVAAAGVHPVDAVIRSGFLVRIGALPARDEAGLGSEAAGVVEAVGPGVTRYAVGDAVIGLHSAHDKASGAYAEHAVFAVDELAHAPKAVGTAEAAVIPSNGLIALDVLERLGVGTAAGVRTLLVTGAGGGVGGYVVELAAARGVEVIALAAEDEEELVRSLGAKGFVARGADVPDAVRALVPGGADALLDTACIGAPVAGAVRDGGTFVKVRPDEVAADRGVRVVEAGTRPDPERLAELVALVDAGELTLRVAGTYGFAEAADAHRRMEAGGVRGRLVLVP